MTHWVHRFYVAVLSLALLIGPCLSLTGFVGAGPAHAHSQISQVDVHSDPSDHMHAQHVSGVASHGSHDSSHHPSPGNAPISCEDMCEGWGVSKCQRFSATDSSPDPLPDYNDADFDLIGVVVGLYHSTRRLRSSDQVWQSANYLVSARPYALTNRYRL
jgi:hypothetical protein